MRKHFRIGFVLGIALLMLLPVYARAQMGLMSLTGGTVNFGGAVTVVNLSADMGQVISFSIASSLPNPTFLWLAYPNGATGFNTANFSWNPTDPGPYRAVFEATAGGETEQLIVMITINSSTGGSPPPGSTCTYGYSAWSACQPNNTQTRTVTSITPAGCSGTPILSQSCTYAAPPPPANGTPWVWGSYPMFTLNMGEVKTYIVHLDAPNNLLIQAMGLYIPTDGTFTWQFPDGTLYTGSPIKSVQLKGALRVAAPAGDHVWKITSNADGSGFKLQLDIR